MVNVSDPHVVSDTLEIEGSMTMDTKSVLLVVYPTGKKSMLVELVIPPNEYP